MVRHNHSLFIFKCLSRSATKYSQVPFSVKMELEKGEYLDFVELGEVLNELAYEEATVHFGKRYVPSRLVEEGKINLLATDTGKTCLKII